jgi:hypothetical protein
MGIDEGLPIVELKADKSKELRAESASVFFENGKVYFPLLQYTNEFGEKYFKQADFVSAVEGELLEFPDGVNDDIVDNVSYAVQMARQYGRNANNVSFADSNLANTKYETIHSELNDFVESDLNLNGF